MDDNTRKIFDNTINRLVDVLKMLAVEVERLECLVHEMISLTCRLALIQEINDKGEDNG